jgi:hypothetical protein
MSASRCQAVGPWFGIKTPKEDRDLIHARLETAKLLELVTILGHDVKIVVGPVRRRAGTIELQFA